MRITKKPIVARLSLIAGVWMATTIASAAEPGLLLEEPELVRRALARAGIAEQTRAVVELARADAMSARRWANPELGWDREQTSARGVTATEDLATVSQRFDVSGRRGLRGDAAERRVEAAERDATVLRLDVERAARVAFTAALAEEQRVAAIETAMARIEGVAAAVALRASRGDVAG
jgi:cobalt-zinc-cadmium efflux system outer membrane protein